LPDEGEHARAAVVPDDRPRLVAHAPAALLQASQEIDVLADGQLGLEPPDVLEGRSPAHERRRGNVGEAAVGADDARLRAEVKGRAEGFVSSQGAGPNRPDAGSDGAHGGVLEVPDEAVEPSGGGAGVGIEEGDKG